MTGVGSFAINPSSVGTLAGYIALTYDLYSVDPNSGDFDPATDTLATGQYLYAPASITVGTTVTTTPESGTLLLLATGLSLLWLKRKSRAGFRRPSPCAATLAPGADRGELHVPK